MSHSPNDANDRQRELPGAFGALGSMLRAGRSFSGREKNCCFLNTLGMPGPDQRFANISSTSGLDFPDDGRAIALVDWDQDGDQDVWISNRNAPRVRFLRNDLTNKGHFAAFRLVGSGATTNRDAIGARVEVVLEDTSSGSTGGEGSDGQPATLIRTLRAGEGFLAQSSKWLHFGLGDATKIASVTVRWPCGTVDRVEQFGPLSADRRYELVQGSGRARDVSGPTRPLQLAPSQPELPAATGQIRLPLLVRLPVLNLKYETFERSELELPLGQRRPFLINLWSSSCHPCLTELAELSGRERDLRDAGIQVIALSVDHLNDSKFNPAESRQRLQELGYPFAAGIAPRGLVSYLQGLHAYHSPLNREFPLPTSFLIDEEGRLAYIYKGPISVNQLIQDASDPAGSPSERFERAASLAGRSIQHPVALHTMTNRETSIRFHLAEELRKSGQGTAAIEQYQELLRLEPRLAKAYNNLALTLRQQGDLEQAKIGYQRALEIDPESAEVHNNLGVLLLRQGQWADGARHFEQALEIDPGYLDAAMNLGFVAEKQRNWSRAEALFLRAQQIAPNFAKAEFQLGVVAERQGKTADAARRYESALRMDPADVDAHINLGVVSAHLGNLAKAMSHFKRALQLNPNLPEAYNNLGLVLESQGQLLQARQHYEQALRIAPNHPGAKANLRHLRTVLNPNQK